MPQIVKCQLSKKMLEGKPEANESGMLINVYFGGMKSHAIMFKINHSAF